MTLALDSVLPAAQAMYQRILDDVDAVRKLRHDIHAHPELAFEECKTACKTFQGPGEKSVEKFPPQVVQ